MLIKFFLKPQTAPFSLQDDLAAAFENQSHSTTRELRPCQSERNLFLINLHLTSGFVEISQSQPILISKLQDIPFPHLRI